MGAPTHSTPALMAPMRAINASSIAPTFRARRRPSDAPLAWAMGVEAADILQFGTLLGEKVAVNEFVAYASLRDLRPSLSERSVIIGTYALCGFANFSSIAIQIGGIGGIAPSRKSEIAALGLRAVVGGALASWMTATIAGVLVG